MRQGGDKFGIGDVSLPAAGPAVPRCEHVWLIQEVKETLRLPGILLAFRKDGRGRWEGRVVWATPGTPTPDGGAHLRLEWVDAERIERRS